MSAAFQLEFTGAPAPCSFPHCIREAFHEGEHEFKADKRTVFEFGGMKLGVQVGGRRGHCMVCGTAFVVFGVPLHVIPSLCDSEACAAHYRVRRCGGIAPLLCPCPQRPYPHELAVHHELRSESYHPARRFVYPWSLCLSERRELSTERKVEG